MTKPFPQLKSRRRHCMVEPVARHDLYIVNPVGHDADGHIDLMAELTLLPRPGDLIHVIGEVELFRSPDTLDVPAPFIRVVVDVPRTGSDPVESGGRGDRLKITPASPREGQELAHVLLRHIAETVGVAGPGRTHGSDVPIVRNRRAGIAGATVPVRVAGFEPADPERFDIDGFAIDGDGWCRSGVYMFDISVGPGTASGVRSSEPAGVSKVLERMWAAQRTSMPDVPATVVGKLTIEVLLARLSFARRGSSWPSG